MIETNAEQLSQRMAKRGDKYASQMRRANLENAELVKRTCEELSHGGVSKQREQMLGNPYSKSHPHPPLPPYIINDQGGTFARSWMVVESDGPDGPAAEVVNTAPHAKYMRGTKHMIERPILQEALRRTEGQRRLNIEGARRNGLMT